MKDEDSGEYREEHGKARKNDCPKSDCHIDSCLPEFNGLGQVIQIV
ncbi:MAG TPA: hypothetical protein VG324_11415 [Blastocatellia bacterium]|nr:hypothetical protein [Blastocatellia bacterium]